MGFGEQRPQDAKHILPKLQSGIKGSCPLAKSGEQRPLKKFEGFVGQRLPSTSICRGPYKSLQKLTNYWASLVSPSYGPQKQKPWSSFSV